jgi:cell division septation protein DedD
MRVLLSWLALAVVASLVAGCSREQQDWRTAEGVDSIEAYNRFLQRHPDSELATQARTRVAQLTEDRDWQHAGSLDTADGYREFLTQHPNGKWAQEARIRIENFSLGGPPSNEPPVHVADLSAPPAPRRFEGSGAPAGASDDATPGVMRPGEAASPANSPPVTAGAPSTHTSAPPVASTATQPATAAVSGGLTFGGYGIQLGAFRTEDSANSEWRQLATRFGSQLRGLTPHVMPADTPSGPLFRLQASVGEEARARALCAELKKQQQVCVPVPPR